MGDFASPVTSQAPVRPPRRADRFVVLTHGAANYPGVTRHPQWGLPTLRAGRIPAALARLAAAPHSLELFVQDILNGSPLLPSATQMLAAPVHTHQAGRVADITAAFEGDAPGYLLVSPTGSGKTAMALAGLRGVRPGLVLVITKSAVIPQWRAAIDVFGGPHRYVVINVERIWRLFEHPSYSLPALPLDVAAEVAASGGVPQVVWDAVIVDECQILVDPESVRSRLVARLLSSEYSIAPFFLPTSATPFSTPGETSYVADLIAYAAGVKPPGTRTGPGYLAWLESLCLDGAAERSGVPTVERIKALLYGGGVGSAVTAEDLGFAEQQRELRAVELAPAERERYQQAWEAFRAVGDPGGTDLSDPAADQDQDAPQARALRLVQKASLLKVPYIAAHVADLVAGGHQVIVAAWYLDSIHDLHRVCQEQLAARGLPDQVVSITGEEPGLRERKRRAFQVGRARVVITNAVEGVNLHACEADAGGPGVHASNWPRVTVIADVLNGGKRMLHAEGRGQRDGQQAPVRYLVAAGTYEVVWLARALRAIAGTQDFVLARRDCHALLALAEQLESDPTFAMPTGSAGEAT